MPRGAALLETRFPSPAGGETPFRRASALHQLSRGPSARASSSAAPPRASSCRRRNVSAMRRSACAAARHSAQANNSVNSDTATIATQIRPAPFPVSRAARRAFFLFCAPGADFMRGGLTSAGKTRIMKFAADALVAQQDRAAAS